MANVARLPDGDTAVLRSQPPAVPPHLQSTEILWESLKPITLSPKSRHAKIANWGGTFIASPSKVFEPKNVTECAAILELARRTGNKVRAVGKAHSPSDLMMSEDWCIRMEGLSGILDINSDQTPSLSVLAGTIVSDINEALNAHDPPLAMKSLGSISEQTIGGLISTATHGSGLDFPCVSTFVTELSILLPLPPQQGGITLTKCSRTERAELFNASLCGLGATGLIVQVKMDIDPAFRLRHLVEEVKFDYLVGQRTGYPQVQPVQSDESNPAPVSVGKLLAHNQPLPPPLPRYLPQVKTSSPAEIWPLSQTEDSAITRHSATWTDPSDDGATRDAQDRIHSVVSSAQHTRIWYFHHVGMATLSRANRTLDPPVEPKWSERVYASVVGFHFTQFLLFVSRYHHSLPPRIGRVIHYLTHPAFPHQVPQNVESQSSTADGEASTVAPVDSLSRDYQAFTAGTQAQAVPSLHSHKDLLPLQPHHPHSISTNHSWKVFNMDCLFPQYTTEWSIPFEHTASCLRALRDWLDEEQHLISTSSSPIQLHMPIEIRFTDADGIWLSHGYGRKNTYIGLITYRPYNISPPYRKLFRKFENLMRHFAGRPHWAKEHTCGVQELSTLYPHLEQWKKIRQEVDPGQVMVNANFGRHLLGLVGEEFGSRVFKRRLNGRVGKL